MLRELQNFVSIFFKTFKKIVHTFRSYFFLQLRHAKMLPDFRN